MKPKDYVRKYNLENTGRLTNSFWGDMMLDFAALLETGAGMEHIKGFENATRAIRSKWDGIRMKSGKVSAKGWNYFFAKYVAPMREDLFPEEMDRRKKEKQERKERYDDHRAWERDAYGSFEDSFRKSFFEHMYSKMAQLFGIGRSKGAFDNLGLDIDIATAEDVKVAYREAAKLHHPDKGGNRVKFEEYTKAKNLALAYLQNKQ